MTKITLIKVPTDDDWEVPGWDSKTKWPKSALDILSSKEMEMLEGME